LGQAAENIDELNFRLTPGTGATIIGSVSAGDLFVVLEGSLCSQTQTAFFRWWRVYFDGQTGWLAEGDGTSYFAEPVELPENAQVIIEELVEDSRGDRFSYLQEPPQNLPIGTIVTVSVSVLDNGNATNYTYADIADAQAVIAAIFGEDVANGQVKEFTILVEGVYSVYGESNLLGILIAVIVLPEAAGGPGRGPDANSNTDAGGNTNPPPPAVPGRPSATEQPTDGAANAQG
jgi:hypothetical protein